MHIKELQLSGFKSFQNKTRLCLSPGMNAVIGPNGCGKTNILDALRWVLGEQSFSLLRCGRTEDLIFGGTSKVPATNYAEVKLVLATDDLPQFGTEVEIRRRYFRTGESEYFLNRQPCRLKDIQEVFLASGVGTKAYSTFDLRQMREIIAGRIRRMFEEAATLAKYQEAKADCQRKLELTETDLARLDDIIAERERVVRSLRRQAGRLRAYERLREEEKRLRLYELKHEYDSVGRDLEQTEKDVGALEQAEAARLTEIRKLEEESRQHRGRLRQEQSLRDRIADELRQRKRELAELENENLLAGQKVEFLKESAARAAAEAGQLADGRQQSELVLKRTLKQLAEENAREQQLEAELNSEREKTQTAEKQLYELRKHEQAVREQLQDLLERQHEAKRRLVQLEAVAQNQAELAVRLKAELDELERRRKTAAGELAGVNGALEKTAAVLAQERNRAEDLTQESRRIQSELAEVRRELGTARLKRNRIEKELAVLQSAAPDLLAECRKLLGDKVAGQVCELWAVKEGWERACEAALEPVVDSLVVRGQLEGSELDTLNRQGPEAGCSLVGDGTGSGPAEGVPQDRAIIGRLSEYVELKPGVPDIVRKLVDSCLVVRSAAEVIRLANAHPGWSFVTREGCARLGDGRLVVSGRARGRLRLRRVIGEKSEEHDEAGKLVTGLELREHELELRRVEVDRQIEHAREVRAQLEREKSGFDATARAQGERKVDLDRDCERVRNELRSAEASHRNSDRALGGTRQELDGLKEQIAKQTGVLGRVEEQVAAEERAVRARLDAAGESLAKLSEQRQKGAQLDAQSRYLRQTIEERVRRAAELERAAVEAQQEIETLEQGVSGRSPRLEEVSAAVRKLEEKLDGLRVAELTTVEEDLEKNLDELRRAREQNQSILMEQRLKQHELRQRQAAVAEEAQSDYATDISQFSLQSAAPAAPGLETEDAGEVADRLSRVRNRIEALGKVNPLALGEFEQEKQDLERLRAQRQDVAAAQANLTATMREIDQHACERFLDTFQQVRAQFKEVFGEMFLEGEADLVLVDEEKPLESEVAIFARPRGKTPKRLEQLSDGEKALLAVSLLFAFYRVKPAPFCFLDEIDAPLDDANVGRFADYLRSISESTQVVIITHNRLTVERADALFGVTAEEPGVSKLVSVSLAEYQRTPAGAVAS